MKLILDACCGSRMCWFDKHNSAVVYMDNRSCETTLCDGRKLKVRPDVVADFRDIPFPDSWFRLVVFDPPHLIHAGEKSWIGMKYGILDSTWREDIRRGFDECMRVLDDYGVLIFKWSEDQITTAEILRVLPVQPLFGHRRGKSIWLCFMKFSEA